MKTAKHICITFLLGVALSGVAHSQTAGPEAANEIAVVVNAMNPLSDLALPELRKMLLGERRFWKGNVQVRLVLREPGARERDRVIKLVLNMRNADFAELWRAKVFRGEAADEPPAMTSSALAGQYVGRIAGGITFMLAKNVPSNLKVLSVDGKLPGQAGYILK